MKEIQSYNDLMTELQTHEMMWLLLYKQGSEQSECALKSYIESVSKINGNNFYLADVSRVRDIHPKYGLTSVPALLEFKKGVLINVIKGCYQPAQFKAIFENAIFVAKSSDENKTVPSVVVYTTPTCSWCTTLKRHLDNHKIKYREIDVSSDQKAAEAMVRKSGQQGVPQTEINGQMIVGFDRERINRLLNIK